MARAGEPATRAEAERQTTLVVLALACFAVFYNNLIVSPLLVELSRSLGVGLGEAGQLVAGYALPSALVALLAGPLVDRYGRRPVLVAGLSLVAATSVGSALAPDFPTMLACRVAAGVGGAAVWPATLSAVGDLFAFNERGRAMSWLSVSNMLAPTLGVPAGALVADLFGWRAAFWLVAALLIVAVTMLLVKLPGARGEASSPRFYLADYVEVARSRGALAMVGFGLVSHVFWHGFLTYAGAFYQATYGLAVGQLAPILSGVGVAVMLGNVLGGWAADRYGSKRVAVGSLLITSTLLCAQLSAALPLALAVALHLVWSVPNGARVPSANAILTEVLPERRGTVISASSAASSLGTLIGASSGGLILAGGMGFCGLGVLCASFGMLSAGVLYFLVLVGPAARVERA